MGFNKNNVVFTKGDNDLENSENNNNNTTATKQLRLNHTISISSKNASKDT